MKYEWDKAKRMKNIQKHGVDFTLVENFDWNTALVCPDKDTRHNEERFIALGVIFDRLYCLIYNNRGITVRVISLRKATSNEVKRYENQ
ncbi:MAG: BrnT family toxin [Candidatus Riflebacteria bacterium]|nr:BrnT family toxin [Candidatus Riflebacteria bacterium]